MNIEVLKENLSPETYATVEKELEGKEGKLADLSTGDYVAKGKYDALETQLNNTQTLLTDTTAKLEEAISKAGDNDALKQELANLKTQSQTDLDNLKGQYEEKLKISAIMAEISKTGANDPADILPYIDTKAVTITDKGAVGLAEQIEGVKTAKPYLFKAEQKPGASGLSHGSGGDDTAQLNKMRAIMGLPPIK